MAILVTCEACKQTFRVRDEYLDKKAWCPACRAPITLTGERVPNHEVFISYSNKDKHVADAICAKLEALPLRCWIAPRDVAAGHSWGSSIIEAIEEAKVMVLVYSGNSNLSPQVIREVERAVSKGLVLVPFRIEATMMSKDMEYFLSSSHWIDALTPPLEQHLVELGELVRTVLFRKEKEAAAQKPVQPAKPDPVAPTAPASTTNQSKSRTKLWIAAAIALVAVLGMASWWFGSKANQPTIQKAGATTSSVTTVQPSLVMTTPKPVETPVAMTAPAPSMGGAAITVSCSEKVQILPVKIGQSRLGNKAQQIESISPQLAGFEFVSSRCDLIMSYVITVNQDGVLYALGSNPHWLSDSFSGANVHKWEDASGVISGKLMSGCICRKVAAGEIIKLNGRGLMIVAKSIDLVPDGKAEFNTQTATPSPTTATMSTSSTNNEGAAITISCSEPVRILPLEVKQPTLYDSQGGKLINNISPELTGWQFVSVPWHTINSYEIRINQDGILYAFGGGNDRRRTIQNWIGTVEVGKWEDAHNAIIGPSDSINFCLRRKVTAGEIIKLKGLELQFAAKSIELLRDGKTQSRTQTTAPIPTPPAATPPSAPQPSQPWTNSLGMKFVPVPGTAVLFSIWDTRVQDYQAFVSATGRAWEKAKFMVAPSQPEFEQGPTHPAVMVSWNDAKAFCAWLTEKERRAGTLTSAQEYRLPMDLEWSAAVGLENEAGSTPQARQNNGAKSGVYPWGTQWPPPLGAGNYGWTLRVDDFAKTSPVGSFAANKFGLYDMGGNVFQWCEDFWDSRSSNRVLRGSSWWHSGTNGQQFLFSSWRNKKDPNVSNIDVGFRCVLAKVGTGAAN